MNRGGFYICLEGPDGSGKSTLADALVASDDMAFVRKQIFPSPGPIGTLIREVLAGRRQMDPRTLLYLFCADGFEQQPELEESLAEGHVVVDRHPTLSGRVFQQEHHRIAEIEAVYRAANEDGLRKPSVTYIIDAPAEVLLERQKVRQKYKDVVFERDSIDHVEKIRQRYLSLARSIGAFVLDGTKPTADLVQGIQADLRLLATTVHAQLSTRFPESL